jgi:radical SAM family uncharacterized protein
MGRMGDVSNLVERELLPFVQQPGQYIDGEANRVKKDWTATPLRFCLAFPDAYTIGISHYGSGIIYEMLNARADTLCERTYLPWTDAQERMRAAKLPLFSWESRREVRDFDVLGISLQYELLYSNVLNLLDLAGIPLRAANRTESDPLVLAGGPGTNNPEPMAPFIDLYLLGDAEEALPAVLDELAAMKLAEPTLPRAERIAHLAAKFHFLYAPAFYEPRYGADGRLQSIAPTRPDLPATCEANFVADLDAAPAVVRPLVPLVEAVHDRLAIEIMRGCPRRCRFCEAGHTKGKVRLRSPEKILEIAKAAIAASGYDEITLLSLSSSDHPELLRILALLDAEFRDRNISLALPSLRTNEQLAELPGLLTRGRKSGLTLVPEAATDRLRRAIGKDLDEQHLLDAAREAFRRGWMSIKLYFMIGLPGETPEDVAAIIDLSARMANLRREFEKGPGQINISVAPLIPRPHTPLQWLGMRPESYIHDTRTRLRELVRPHRNLRLKFHHIERTMLEGVLARGDRRLADAIEGAYRAGAHFDAWDETFHYPLWLEAFRQAGLDPADYAHRERAVDECLPWSHILMGSTPEQLRRQYEAVFAAIG